MNEYLIALFGGALIGLAVSLMMLWNGKVAGISGILYGAAVKSESHDRAWRWHFIGGLLAGGLLLQLTYPNAFSEGLQTESWTVVLAGLLVGFGTVMGNGCTSGHGVCGISRFSPRSIVATLSFIGAGVTAVFIFRQLGVLP